MKITKSSVLSRKSLGLRSNLLKQGWLIRSTYLVGQIWSYVNKISSARKVS